MGKQIVTREDILSLDRGAVLDLEPDALVTPRALDAAREIGVTLQQGGMILSGELSPVASGGSPGGAAPPLPMAPGDEESRAASVPPVQEPAEPGECADGEGKIIVTAVGRNRPHILAEIAGLIGDRGGDIADINQRVLDGYFHLILIVNIGALGCSFRELREALEGLSKASDYRVTVQHERVFQYMHRV